MEKLNDLRKLFASCEGFVMMVAQASAGDVALPHAPIGITSA